MKNIFMLIVIIGTLVGFYYLYQMQLGAIPFFLISIYSFTRAYSQLSRKIKNTDKNEKDNGRKI
ncbi:hypothetical protein [Bacillus sp. S/N-304-OC-R1]|uniref:hypothetical protein n=1 Tax=Bacillus sp. S/N-304-OC-R1 TaxID=2758034 RepID=UPI001C8DA9A5|nr:hypothetical protein [Bacillus sp. S/N-304-OC-R1]MBY0123276.1 hypothetical protein [Bacillus sp. S/N-304-OC-R1]